MDVVSLYFVLLNLGIATYFDCVYRRIPNHFVAWVLAGGVGINLLESKSLMWAGMFFLAFLVAFPLYLIGAVGAGDVKLFTVLSIFLSWNGILLFGMYSMVVAAIYGTIYKCVFRKKGRTRIPMAPAMLAGALILMKTGGF